MKTYDLYGCDSDIETARDAIEKLLVIKMEKHESSYHCGEYYRLGMDGMEHFMPGQQNSWVN
jgi:hypothetical protein